MLYTTYVGGVKISFPTDRIPSFSKGEEVANILRFEIISGNLNKSSTISENTIAKKYDISRSPAREALRILKNEGLVSLERMGAVIKGLSKKDMDEINDIRLLLEGFCMKQCAKENNDSLQASLNYSIENMKISAMKNDFIELAIQDITFHESIIKASNHMRVLHTWNGIKNIVVTALLIATEERLNMEKDQLDFLIKKHEDIANVIIKGDEKEIEEVLNIHFEDTRKTVINSLFHKKNKVSKGEE